MSKEQRIQRVIDTAVEMTVPLSSNYIGALIELNNKDLLIGQRNGQIAYLPGSPEQEHLPIVEKINDLNLGITIVAMAQVENFLYLGTTDHYLYKINLNNGVISQFNHTNGFSIAHIRVFYSDREGRLWIGTDDGLGYLNQDRFIPVYFDNGQRMTSRIHNLQQDASGIIWIATMDGLFALNPDTLIAQHHSVSGAAGRMLHTLMVGSDNKLWLAYLNELFKCDIIDIEQISCDAFSQGEPMEFGQNLTPVGEHHIFTENGIIDIQSGSFSPFPNTAFTILKRAYWNTMLRISDGTIAYGSDIGISVLDPKLVDDSAIDSPIYLEKYYVDAAVSAYPMDNQIKLPSSSQNVRIAFNDYQFGEGDMFRYMLKGYDKGWIETYQDVREVSYSHLPPGQFQFLVSKRLGKDLWSPQSQVATLVVIPAWHQQPLVRIASVLLFLLFLYGLYKHRVSTLEKRQGMLEAEVEKRTEELRLKNEQLHYKNKEIEHLANHDQLTGLPSLRLADDRLDMAIEHAKRHQNKCALMYLDLDGFKVINDTHGHDAGDVILKEIAKRFKAEVRGSDTCCRIGGDEFLIILPEAESGASLNTLCQRLVEKTQAPVEFAGKQLHVGVSIGVAFFPDNAKDSSSLRTAADEAMYKVKKSGKNNFTFSQKAS